MKKFGILFVATLALSASLTFAEDAKKDEAKKTYDYDPAATRLVCINESKGDIFVGDGVQFAYSVANKGTKDLPAGAFSFEVFCNGKKIGGDGLVPELKAGAGISYGRLSGKPHFTPTKAGTYTYKIVLKVKDKYKGNLKNNVISKTITVKEKK